MKRQFLVAIFAAVALTACDKKPAEPSVDAPAGASRINISTPADGDKIDANAQIKLAYDITVGGEGDHAHLYVDDRRIAMLRQMKGSYMIFPLDPGIREICIKVVNSNHTPIGVSQCVKVTVG